MSTLSCMETQLKDNKILLFSQYLIVIDIFPQGGINFQQKYVQKQVFIFFV